MWATREVRISEELRKRGILVYCPMRAARVRWKDRVKVVQRPMLPSYLFVSGDVDVISKARLVSGVFAALPSNSHPRPVEQAEIDLLRLIESSGAAVTPVACFPVGRRVEVRHGTFAGIVGIVRRAKGKTHLVVQVNIGADSARAVDVEIDMADLKPNVI